MDLINWKPAEDNNVQVLNDTIDLYRYFDATKQAEFLYSCVQETIDKTIPEEVEYLEKYDRMKSAIKKVVPQRYVSYLAGDKIRDPFQFAIKRMLSFFIRGNE